MADTPTERFGELLAADAEKAREELQSNEVYQLILRSLRTSDPAEREQLQNQARALLRGEPSDGLDSQRFGEDAFFEGTFDQLLKIAETEPGLVRDTVSQGDTPPSGGDDVSGGGFAPNDPRSEGPSTREPVPSTGGRQESPRDTHDPHHQDSPQLFPDSIPGSVSNLTGVPGEHEVWRNSDTGQLLLVIYVPNTDIPLIWDIPESIADQYFPEGAASLVGNNVYTTSQILDAGAIDGGLVSDIPTGGSQFEQEHPWDIFIADYEQARKVNPALADPEIMGVYYMAYLEERQVFDYEIFATDYYQNSTAEQRQWIEFATKQPKDAANAMADARLYVADALRQLGVEGVSEAAIDYMASQSMVGNWTNAYLGEQFRLLEVGQFDGLDDSLASLVSGAEPGVGLETNRQQVVAELNKWLGPQAAQHYSEKQIDDWAKKMIDNPSHLDVLVDQLKDQRLVLFPELQDREVSYDSMAAPWRNVWMSVLGEKADEMSSLFPNLVRANDMSTAEAMLRQHGLDTGNQKVGKDALDGLARSSSGGRVVGVAGR